MARMDDDAQQPVGRCGTSIHPQEDRQDHVIDLTVKHTLPLDGDRQSGQHRRFHNQATLPVVQPYLFLSLFCDLYRLG